MGIEGVGGENARRLADATETWDLERKHHFAIYPTRCEDPEAWSLRC